LRRAWVLFNVVLWTVLLGGLGILLSLFERRGRIIGYLGRVWARIILWASGVSYRVQGLEYLDRRKNYVFAGNHESAYDILLAFAALPYQLVPIAKVELKKIPVFGWAMRAARHIFVDRSNRERALASLREAKESLIQNPRSVLLFPEGTRSLDGKIHRFKKGGLVLAINTNMPVVPMACCGTAQVVTKGSWQLNPRPIELRLGKPLDTTDLSYEDRNQFVEQVRAEVIRLKQSWEAEQ
jgi:1-acyl-sn-glycerol-3-phosphate acyltransferase